jgi:hypothetical protein
MEFYRCFFLDDAAAVFGRTEFHALDDDEANERAERATQMTPKARGYTLWQSGRLVAETGSAKQGDESLAEDARRRSVHSG